jgi:hypothetical protein
MRVISLNGLGSFLAIALTFSHFGAETRADDYEVNVSSLSSKESGGDSSTVTNKLWYANAFTIQAGDKNTAYFNSIFLALDPRDMSDAAGLVVEVYSNDSTKKRNVPKESLGTFKYNGSSYPNSDEVKNAGYILADGDFLSLSDAKYWVVVSTEKDVDVKWLKKQQDVPDVTKYASILSEVMKKDVGKDTWNLDSEDKVMMRFAINTPVPEPSTYVLGMIVAAILALTGRNQSLGKKALNVS